MREKSSDSVKIHYLNIDTVLGELHQAAHALKMSNLNVKRIVLFGSLASTQYGPGSDADVLIVLQSDKRRAIDRIPELSFAFSSVSIPVEVFPLTERELERQLGEENLFWKRALETGVELGETSTMKK